MSWRSLHLFIFVAKNKLGAQRLFSQWKISWDEVPTYFSLGNNKSWAPNLFFAAKIKVRKTFMTSNLFVMFENKSWGYKSQFQRNVHSLWSRQSQISFCFLKTDNFVCPICRWPDPGILTTRSGPQLHWICRRSYAKRWKEKFYGTGDMNIYIYIYIYNSYIP